MSNPIVSFRNHIDAVLGFSPDTLLDDGNIHRFATSDKRGDKSGWYALHAADGLHVGNFGDWRTDTLETWCSKQSEAMSKKERDNLSWCIDKAKRQQNEAREAAHGAAGVEAVRIWGEATDAADNHPYLECKQVAAVGIRQAKVYGDLCLVVPVRIGGELVSLQYIQPNGTKRFLKDGKTTGGFHLMGSIDRSIIIVEGYATGATVYAATKGKAAIAVAFHCGNLKAVAEALHKQHPDCSIIIAADNDHATNGNPGLTKGNEAAGAVNGRMFSPPDSIKGTDFNDMALERGLDAVRNILTRHDGRPWANARIPAGCGCNDHGVYIYSNNDKPDEQLTNAPCWVSALSRDGEGGGNWGRLVCWLDHDGQEHSEAVPASFFHMQSNELICLLANEGLPVIHGKERKLIGYLSSFKTASRLLSSPATGWKGESFVLPQETINEPKGERVIYQPATGDSSGDAIKGKGTLDEWRETIASRALTPLVRFGIAAALTAPFRYHSGVDAGGFHFYGTTSRGKTTMMQMAASVWGSEAYMQTWNATTNGLEAMAAGFNDLPLCIDEVGQSETRNFGAVIYNLMSGTGKVRMTKAIGRRAMRAWRVMVLSNGEIPVSECIAASGQVMRGGHMARLVDIPISHLFSGAEAVDAIKAARRDCYGTAGVALLSRHGILIRFIQAWKGYRFAEIGEANSPEAGRIRKRFALVACVAELGIETGILPWRQGEGVAAAAHAYSQWSKSGNATTEAERGAASVRDYILKHDKRFERAKDNAIPLERDGWYRNGLYHFLPDAFTRACNGANPEAVKRELMDRKLIKSETEGKTGNRFYSSELEQRIRVISVYDDLMES